MFVLKGPVYLVAVSRTGEPVRHLQRQLEHLHGCIVFVLTQKVRAARADRCNRRAVTVLCVQRSPVPSLCCGWLL